MVCAVEHREIQNILFVRRRFIFQEGLFERFPDRDPEGIQSPKRQISDSLEEAMAKKETRKCVKLTRHNDSVLRMFVGFVLHESLRVHSTHQDVTHFERAQAYPENMVENCADTRKGGKCEKQFNDECRTFVYQHRMKRHFTWASRNHRAHVTTCRTNREDREKEHTHGFLHNCQPPACQGIPVATRDRSERTQCQAKKTGDNEQTNA